MGGERACVPYRFRVGDMVRCTQPYVPSDLVKGRVYTVVGFDNWPSPGIYLAEVADYPCSGIGWALYRFELVPDDDSVFERRSRPKYSRTQSAVLDAVVRERVRQDAKFGPHGNLHNMDPFQRLSVLTDEVGELAQALNDAEPFKYDVTSERAARLAHMRDELVQVAAVAVAWLELLEERGANA